MPEYCICTLDYSCHRVEAKNIECVDDQEAVQQALRTITSYDVEVWQRDRFVALLPRYEKAPPESPIAPHGRAFALKSRRAPPGQRRSMCECTPDRNPFAPAGFRRARYTLPSGGRAFPPPCNQRRLTAEPTASSSRGTPPLHGAGIDCTLYLITMHGEEALAGHVTMGPPLGTVHRRLLTPPWYMASKQGRERSHDPFAERQSTKCCTCRSC
jgi:hypothetical protein